MQERFGWSIPVYSMRYWIVGVSDPEEPASEIVDGGGFLTLYHGDGEPREALMRLFAAVFPPLPVRRDIAATLADLPALDARSCALQKLQEKDGALACFFEKDSQEKFESNNKNKKQHHHTESDLAHSYLQNSPDGLFLR